MSSPLDLVLQAYQSNSYNAICVDPINQQPNVAILACAILEVYAPDRQQTVKGLCDRGDVPQELSIFRSAYMMAQLWIENPTVAARINAAYQAQMLSKQSLT